MGNYIQTSSIMPRFTEDPRRVPCSGGALLTNKLTKGPFLTILKYNSTAIQLTHSKYTTLWVFSRFTEPHNHHLYLKGHF